MLILLLKITMLNEHQDDPPNLMPSFIEYLASHSKEYGVIAGYILVVMEYLVYGNVSNYHVCVQNLKRQLSLLMNRCQLLNVVVFLLLKKSYCVVTLHFV
jgi:hypothetical protein